MIFDASDIYGGKEGEKRMVIKYMIVTLVAVIIYLMLSNIKVEVHKVEKTMRYKGFLIEIESGNQVTIRNGDKAIAHFSYSGDKTDGEIIEMVEHALKLCEA